MTWKDVVYGLLLVLVRAARINTVRGRWFRLKKEEADIWCGIIIAGVIVVAIIGIHLVLVVVHFFQ